MTSLWALYAGVGADALLGEPRRWHPLVGFGRLAEALERRFHADRRGRGALLMALLLTPPVLLAAWLAHVLPPWPATAFEALCLYLALGGRSLAEHARPVQQALAAGDLERARARVAWLVSRDTAGLDREGVARATVESVLENGSDAVFGSLFWFLVAGAPGVLLHRLANTLDAMWGYRTARHARFGWAAARLDDALNYLPARLAAASYALLGATRRALACWRSQAPRWKSPNAGPVMAAGAGALGLSLGGTASYHGRPEPRPELGEGRPPRSEDIGRAIELVRHATLLWLALLLPLLVIRHA